MDQSSEKQTKVTLDCGRIAEKGKGHWQKGQCVSPWRMQTTRFGERGGTGARGMDVRKGKVDRKTGSD